MCLASVLAEVCVVSAESALSLCIHVFLYSKIPYFRKSKSDL